MMIKLVQSGGILPITKEASAQVDWSKEERDSLLKKIAVSDAAINHQVRDGIGHTLEIDGVETSVDINKADGKYAALFDKLKSNLKIVKN